MNAKCILMLQKKVFIPLSVLAVAILGCTSKKQIADNASMPLATVTIDPTIRYQVIEGWGEGGMDTFTPAWYVLYRPEIRETILDSLYTLNDNGLGLNICRFLIPMGDNPKHDHMKYMIPLANKPFEPENGIFTWEGHENILWRAKGAQQRGAIMWASFYSPPYWLTISGCTGGSKDGKSNNLIAGKEERYAKHICDIVQHIQDTWGISFNYVSPLNEPEADWWKFGGGSPGCHVSDKQAVVVIRELSKQLKQHRLDSKIQACDAAYGNSYWYIENLLKSEAEPLISVMSVHQYITSDEALIKWYELAVQYNKSLWSTEWGDWANAGYPNNNPYEQALKYANKIHEGLKVLKACAWIIWEPGFIYDANMFHLKPRKAYWAVAHYSRHIRPGFQQIVSETNIEECKTSSWIGPDERMLVVVTINEGPSELSVDYDLANFKDWEVCEVRLTSKTQEYESLDSGSIVKSHWSMNMPAGSIMTMIATITN